jgi:hypothetical protein
MDNGSSLWIQIKRININYFIGFLIKIYYIIENLYIYKDKKTIYLMVFNKIKEKLKNLFSCSKGFLIIGKCQVLDKYNEFNDILNKCIIVKGNK